LFGSSSFRTTRIDRPADRLTRNSGVP
jgi:hypothetical protein